MERAKPRTLSGFMELLPAQQAQMDSIMDVLRQTYSLYGFSGMDTPVLEAADVLLAKCGGDTEKQIYRFCKGDSDTELAMRFDLTVPLAKYVAMNYGQLAFPFRRYQIGKVYRGERAQKGRFREFYQADIDIVGDGSLDITADAEMPAVICEVFRRLGIERFCIRINNRKILNGLLESLGLSYVSTEFLNIIDKMDKIGRGAAYDMMKAYTHPTKAEKLLSILCMDDPSEILAIEGQNETLESGLRELENVISMLPLLGVPDDKWRIDLTIARGLDYYTGTVYETTLLDYPDAGSVCSGGRYDNLAGYYTDKKLPGVGISLGVTRLFSILQQGGAIGKSATSCDAIVIPLDDNVSYAMRCAATLRTIGVRTQVYTERKRVKAKFAYANKLGIPYAVVVGETEKSNGTVSLKDMRSGTQVVVPCSKAAAIIKQGL